MDESSWRNSWDYSKSDCKDKVPFGRLKVESKPIANLYYKPSTKHYELSNTARTRLFLSVLSLSTTL